MPPESRSEVPITTGERLRSVPREGDLSKSKNNQPSLRFPPPAAKSPAAKSPAAAAPAAAAPPAVQANGNGAAQKKPSRRLSAEDMGKKQQSIAVSEFFYKNRHLLG